MPVARTPDFKGWLNLCRDPNHEGLYFLGPGQGRITFYSQQVRALRLVHALAETKTLAEKERVAVVGAGAAGTTAAMALALAGAEVTLYCNAGGVLQPQSMSPRLLHPHLYGWPALGSLDDRAGLPILDWTAAGAGQVVSHLATKFATAQAYFKSSLLTESKTVVDVAARSRGWALSLEGEATPVVFSKVVLAMGFGEEAVMPGAQTLGYWSPGSMIASAIEDSPNVAYFLSGNGDGGLTDLMALLIGEFQHVTFAQDVLRRFMGDTLTKAAELAYAGKSLDDDLEPDFDRYIRPALEEAGIIPWLVAQLRNDRRVTFNSQGPLFAYGRAARLNQILAYALCEAAKAANHEVMRTRASVDRLKEVGGRQVVEFDDGSVSSVIDRVVLRHGPKTADRYAPAKIPFQAYLTQVKASVAADPDLGEPPRLDPATFDFFDTRRLQHLVSNTEARDQISVSARRESAVVVGSDAATHQLYEFGPVRLALIADECERGVAREVHLTCPPEIFGSGEALVRLAAASHGRVTLTADPSVFAAWAPLSSLIASRPAPGVKYRPSRLPDPELETAIDACLLRLLDDRLNVSISTNVAPGIGVLSPAIAGALGTTWTTWKRALEADPPLCSRFLRWLYSVDPYGQTSWTGDHGTIPDLTAGLVYMLAAHLGEPLLPSTTRAEGNLEFRDGGVALGSGCRSLGDQPLRDRTDAREWGVNALILSGASEVEIVEVHDRVGSGGLSLRTPRQVRPALIQNSRKWSQKLAASLADWIGAVEQEFADMRERQKAALDEVNKA